MPVGEVTSAMPGDRKLPKMADSQVGSERQQKRDAICVDMIRA